MPQFICTDCKEGRHELCRGGSWCDCLHRPRSTQSRALDNGCPHCTVALRLEVSSLRFTRAPVMPAHSHGGVTFAARAVH